MTTRIWWGYRQRQNQDAWDDGERCCGLDAVEIREERHTPIVHYLDAIIMEWWADSANLRVNYPQLW